MSRHGSIEHRGQQHHRLRILEIQARSDSDFGGESPIRHGPVRGRRWEARRQGLSASTLESHVEGASKTISVEREGLLHEDQVDEILDPAAGLTSSVRACVGMDLLGDLLFQWKCGELGGLYLRKREKIRRPDGLGLSPQRI